MPAEVTLTSGRILRKVEVVKWEKDRVILKHSAGINTIAFSIIKVPSQEDLVELKAKNDAEQSELAAAQRKLALLEEKREAALRLQAEAMAREEENREKASRNGTLMEGQTYEQVRRVLGDYQRYNDYSSGRDRQAIYYQSNGEVFYVYFTDGKVTSWQRSRR